jgi:hypothetical protein
VDCITYLAPLKLYNTQKPYFSQLPCGTQLPRTNLVERGYPVEIRDISGKESLFKLDEAGFEFEQVPTRVSNWTDETVHSEYLPDLSAWLKAYFSCEEVFIYNYNVYYVPPFLNALLTKIGKLRTSDTKASGKGPWRSPIFRVHCGKRQKTFKAFSPGLGSSYLALKERFDSHTISNIWPKYLDNTAESCAKRLEFQFPTKAKAILRGRYRYIE